MLSKLKAAATVTGGLNANAVASLNGEAGPSGDTVNLTSSSADLQIPASSAVAASASTANVTITTSPVPNPEAVTLTATMGTVTVQTTLTLIPAALSGINAAPRSVIGGSSTALAIYLNARAPSGGALVTLSSSSADVAIANSVTIPQGAGSANVLIHTKPVSATEVVTISATRGSVTLQTTLTLNPAALTGLKLLPTSVKGGSTAAFAVYLNGAAGPGGAVVTLSSGSVDATVPATLAVPAGATAANVVVHTKAVSASEQVTLTATLGSATLHTTITIHP